MKTVKLIKVLLAFVGISGAFSVLFGAWLAHAGQKLALIEQSRLETALQYQFIHTLALFITLLFLIRFRSKWLIAASVGFSLGILFFSGSLYLKTLFELASIAKLTPIGGMMFALSWACISVFGYFLSAKQLVLKSK